MEKTIENMDRNRLGILIRCLVILLITGVTNSAAVFVSPLAAHFNWTADAIANVSTTMLLCWTPGALIGGTLMSKIGARNAMLLGAVLFPLGTLTSSFVPQSSPWLLYVTFSFLQGLGNGLAYTVATYVSTGWYPDKRGLVSGLCMAFTGGSSAFLAPICSKLVQSTGIISTLRIVGLVSLVVCVVCALGVRQAPVGYTPAGFAGSASSAETQLESYNVRRALKTRPIWHLIVCTAFFPTMYMIMFPRFSVYMTDAGFTLSAATLGVSIYFIANTLSRLFLGALCDKISYKHVYGICGVLCILSAICLIAAHSLFMFYLTAADVALVPGLVGAAAEIAAILVIMNLLINRARKRGEHFELHPLDPRYDSTGSKPKLIVALIPMAVLFLLFNIWKLNINICLLCSIALSLVLFWPQLRRRDLKAMLNSGAVDSVPMTMTVAAICGFAGVITNTDAFQSMITAITSISIAPILICWVVVALMCMLTGGSSTGQLVALPIIAPKLQALGLTASTIHRVSAFAATTLDSMPYSGSILMLLPMCHMKLKEVYPALFVTTVIATTVGTAAVTLMCVLFPGLA